MHRCMICGKVSKRQCSKCGELLYCSQHCLSEHWREHKLVCRSFAQQRNDVLLFNASCSGDERTVAEIIADGECDVNFPNPEYSGSTPLHAASQNGHVEIVRVLIRAGGNVNAVKTDSYAHTPLFVAVSNGRASVVDLLIKAKASVNYHRRGGPTCLMIACQKGFGGLVRRLIQGKADVNIAIDDEIQETALTIAAFSGKSAEVLDALLFADANINYARADGVTALIAASQNGSIDAVRILTRNKANVNAVANDHLGSTALTLACQQGFDQVVECLLIAGANVEYTRSDGFTSLMMACQQGHQAVVSNLIKAGADPRNGRPGGPTSIWLAKAFNHPGITALLQTRIADLEHQQQQQQRR